MVSLLRKKFTDVCIGHFCAPESLDARKTILSNCLRSVEIEIISYCNRTCWFCPNSYIDRKSAKHFMDDNVYNSIIDQLASFNYSGTLAYRRYSESLSDEIIFERLSHARRMLPKALLTVTTNGDYLNEKCLDKLTECGLDRLRISGYLPNQAEYNAKNIALCADKIEKKIGMPLNTIHEWNGTIVIKQGKRGRMEILLRIENFDLFGIDRGGLIPEKSIKRTSPCALPFYELQIDYNGNVVPCCNIRSDAHEHKDYILGNIGENSMFDIYFSKKAEEWRRSIFYFSDKLKPPCNTCGRDAIVDVVESRHYCESLSSGRQIILEDKNKKLEDKNRNLQTTVSVSQALIHHIKGEIWYRIGRNLGLLRHRTVTDFRNSITENPLDKGK